ncbi:exosortase-dependent surface protein XDP1 [Roseisolibacter sp. H3M3-2]|uniref:exosortase-dependent surface protein XDP1 n=1 Tax=Roseisolibacter sp. H3M3-2 TaxID=3031323 RepID=UPI0023DACE42|nr:exosortase-dependent surface protein XDP1 [Roseisolibacter sp. H3M3-2]MDF1505673.1 PEP-CTERM sorting domain-containing protein [Roseisolibacter sp. H3M3-2]
MSISRLAALAVAFPLLASAAGAQSTWSFTDQSGNGACALAGNGGAGLGNTYTCAAQGSNTPTLTVRAFGIAVSNTAANRVVSAAAVTGPYSGAGIGVGTAAEGGNDADDPNHMMDNAGQNTDFLLLSFLTGAYDLNSVSFGAVPDDSDFQILRWTGVGGPSLVGQTASQLLAGGWELVSSVNGGSSPNAYNVNPGNLASQHWILASYNTALGSAAGLDMGDDEMKVLGIGATAVPGGGAGSVVPEPSTYALLGTGLGFLGLVARRRRRA